MGISQEDKIFRLIENSDYIESYPDLYYKSTKRNLITFGSLEIKSWAAANLQESISSSLLADFLAYKILDSTVSSNRITSWLTSDIFFLRDFRY